MSHIACKSFVENPFKENWTITSCNIQNNFGPFLSFKVSLAFTQIPSRFLERVTGIIGLTRCRLIFSGVILTKLYE